MTSETNPTVEDVDFGKSKTSFENRQYFKVTSGVKKTFSHNQFLHWRVPYTRDEWNYYGALPNYTYEYVQLEPIYVSFSELERYVMYSFYLEMEDGHRVFLQPQTERQGTPRSQISNENHGKYVLVDHEWIDDVFAVFQKHLETTWVSIPYNYMTQGAFVETYNGHPVIRERDFRILTQ